MYPCGNSLSYTNLVISGSVCRRLSGKYFWFFPFTWTFPILQSLAIYFPLGNSKIQSILYSLPSVAHHGLFIFCVKRSYFRQKLWCDYTIPAYPEVCKAVWLIAVTKIEIRTGNQLYLGFVCLGMRSCSLMERRENRGQSVLGPVSLEGMELREGWCFMEYAYLSENKEHNKM